MSKQKIAEAEKDALLTEERLIKEEKDRTSIEKYKVKEIGLWMVLPSLLFLSFFFYGLYDYFANKNKDMGWYIFPSAIFFFLSVLASGVEDDWKKRLEFKEELQYADENYKWINYEDKHIYTDSKFEYLVYRIAKIVSYLVSFVIVGILGVLLFTWIGSISIAPTTVIIVLLIILILKE